jgi:elongation factor P--(R)-beta-lysine ligase
MLRKARSFFAQREILEVDCPALTSAPPLDLHIDVMKVHGKEGLLGYLHTSAEYGMKRLLAQGIGDIYQISHVFREGEIGALHNPEFTMAEWYRCGFSFEQLIEETVAFICLFLGDLPEKHLDYRKMLQHYLQIDYTKMTPRDLSSLAKERGLLVSQEAATWDKDTWLQLLVSLLIEPHLGQGELSVITHFPATQAALAKTCSLNGLEAALRFEIYFNGIELANGYHELSDPHEQQRRFEKINHERLTSGKEPLPIDEKFLKALHTLPDCCGVAVGFDRLMLLRHRAPTLLHVLPFSWQEI